MTRIKEGETRKYVVPLRKGWIKTPRWRRSKRAVDSLRNFIIRHTKVDNVRISNWVNEELWKNGGKNPPGKIEVNAKINKEKIKDKKTNKEVDVPVVHVDLVELPKRIERLTKKKEARSEKIKKIAKPKEEKKGESEEKKETLKERVAKKIKKKEAPKEKKKSVKELAAELHEAEEKKKKPAKITKAQEMQMNK